MLGNIKKWFMLELVAVGIGWFILGGAHSEASIFRSQVTNDEWIWPADGIISDTFGTRKGKHKGIDIAGKFNTPIYAVAEGVIEKSYFSNTYGNVIFIQHQNNYVTVYAHLSVRNVREGQTVNQGDVIGKMGSTGQATGVHLHFETHKAEWTYNKKFALDPVTLLGNKSVGDLVLAGIVNNDANAMEASTRYAPREESRKGMIAMKRNAATPHEFVYIVQAGDTLWSIAAKYQLTVKEIQVRNKKTARSKIHPGEQLFLKTGSYYVVQQGDTLSTISSRRNLSVAKIKAINHLASDVIKPKQMLILNDKK